MNITLLMYTKNKHIESACFHISQLDREQMMCDGGPVTFCDLERSSWRGENG